MAHWPKNSAAKSCVEVQGGLELAPGVSTKTGARGASGVYRPARHRCSPASIAARDRALPSSVLGPVLIPPWNLHLPPRRRSLQAQGCPCRFLAPQTLPLRVLGRPAMPASSPTGIERSGRVLQAFQAIRQARHPAPREAPVAPRRRLQGPSGDAPPTSPTVQLPSNPQAAKVL